MKAWDLVRYGLFDDRRCPKIVALLGEGEKFSMAPLAIKSGSPLSRQLLEEQILFPTFEKHDVPTWPFLPRSLTREYVRLTTGSIVQRQEGWVDKVAEIYEREYRAVAAHGIDCCNAVERKGGKIPIVRPVVSTSGLLALTSTRKAAASVEVAVQRQSEALYVLCYHVAWVAWARVWISKRFPDLDARLAQMAAQLSNDFIGRAWFRKLIRPAAYQLSPTDPPPLDDCIGVVFHSDTSRMQVEDILWSGIAAYDLIRSDRDRWTEVQKRPEARIWVKSGHAPRFHKDKWGQVELANGDLVEWHGFLPPVGIDDELKNALNKGRRRIMETYGSAKRGERPWEKQVDGTLTYDGGYGDTHSRGEFDFEDSPSGGADFEPDRGGATDLHLAANSTPQIQTTQQSQEAVEPAAKKARAAAENARRAKIAKYEAIPEGLWRALYLDAAGDEDYLKLLQIRRRLLASGWPEAEELKPRAGALLTVKNILKKVFGSLEKDFPKMRAFRLGLADDVRFPMELNPGETWDDGRFADLMDQPLTKDDGLFLENHGRALSAKTVERLV